MMKKRVITAFFVAVLCFCLACFISCNNDATQKNKYLLKFISNGANYDVIVVSSESDTTITLPQEPKKDGYSFDGWYLDDGVWNCPFDPAKKITADTDVYVKWTRTTFTITYTDPEGKPLVTEGFYLPTSYTIESETIVLDSYYLPGYKFNGWFDDEGNLVTKSKKARSVTLS